MKKKLFKYIAIPAIGICISFVAVLTVGIVAIISGNQAQAKELQSSFEKLSDEVEAYRSTVTEVAEEYEIGEYANHILCIMQVSTNGIGTDVMNAGEFESNTAYPKQRGMISNPEYSIRCGVQEFKALLQLAGVASPEDAQKLLTVYEAYHINRGYIGYSGGSYSPENAAAYLQQNSLGDFYNTEFANQVSFYLKSLSGGGTGDFKYPMTDYHKISSPFGYRTDPISHVQKLHTGTDFPAPAMTPVHASMDGVVEQATWKGGYGNCVVIRHNATYQTYYAHNTSLNVVAGQSVKQGEVIAFVGSTGNSTGPHCHFEIRVNGKCQNPMPYLENRIQLGDD